MFRLFSHATSTHGGNQFESLDHSNELRRPAVGVRTCRRLLQEAAVFAAVFFLTGVVILPAHAQAVGDRVVVRQDTILKVNNSNVATVHKGHQFEITHVDGDWLWVPLDEPGWIDKRYVAVANPAKAQLSDASIRAGQASAVASSHQGNAENRMPKDPHAPIATALAIAMERQPTVPPARRPSASPRVGVSFGPNGIGLGIRDPRQGSSIMFQFGGRRSGHHGHRGHPARRE